MRRAKPKATKAVCSLCFGSRVNDRGGGPCDRCHGAGEVLVLPLPEPRDPAAVYGWDVTYLTNRGEELTCHYAGTEATARRKAMLKTGAKKILKAEPLTEQQWVRCYGRGRM